MKGGSRPTNPSTESYPVNLSPFIQRLPKAELHLHIEGTLEPELMFELAALNNVTTPFRSPAEAKESHRFSNLDQFLDVYYRSMSVLRTERDFSDLTAAYLERAASQGIRHAEIFFDPQAHTGRGVDFAAVVNGISEGLRHGEERHSITSRLIMCFLRHLEEEDAFATLERALEGPVTGPVTVWSRDGVPAALHCRR